MEETVSAQALRESEELHRITLINMSDAVFITDDEGGFTFVCPNADVIFGYTQEEVRGMGRISRLLGCDLIDPRELGPHAEVRNIEHEIDTKDGLRRVLLVHVKRVSIRGGTVLYVCRDITERKEAEQALLDLGGRLIHAHEEERLRLSQELHDDVGQRLALLSAELGILHRLGTRETSIGEQVKMISAHVDEIGSALRRLSHELHPVMLEQIGLPASIRRLCDETAAATRIVIQREIVASPIAIASDVSLCVYRIAQESLHNVVKHSRATTVTVSLKSADGEIALSVLDDGVGFDPGSDRNASGLGLISIRERARLVHGHMTLTSKPGHGTRVDVRVPLLGVASV
jgi:PAS domain S-box-containing protein